MQGNLTKNRAEGLCAVFLCIIMYLYAFADGIMLILSGVWGQKMNIIHKVFGIARFSLDISF